jgi:ribose transport system substrate-binding protein
VPAQIILPAEVIDRSNYQAWLVPVEQRVCPEWDEVAK